MQLNHSTGWLESTGLRYRESPFCNERPKGTPIDLLVIHNISLPPKQFGTPYIDQLFQGCLAVEDHPFFQEIKNAQVSSHFLIDRQGQLTQYVSVFKRAWHAGQSYYRGRYNCNDFSVGIELEGADDIPFTQIQYSRLVKLAKLLINDLPHLSPDRIAGHSDIAPDRKTDPGPCFDWQYFLNGLNL